MSNGNGLFYVRLDPPPFDQKKCVWAIEANIVVNFNSYCRLKEFLLWVSGASIVIERIHFATIRADIVGQRSPYCGQSEPVMWAKAVYAVNYRKMLHVFTWESYWRGGMPWKGWGPLITIVDAGSNGLKFIFVISLRFNSRGYEMFC